MIQKTNNSLGLQLDHRAWTLTKQMANKQFTWSTTRPPSLDAHQTDDKQTIHLVYNSTTEPGRSPNRWQTNMHRFLLNVILQKNIQESILAQKLTGKQYHKLRVSLPDKTLLIDSLIQVMSLSL